MALIDLDEHTALCEGLPAESAAPLAFRAVVALERRHAPGVRLDVLVGGEPRDHVLQWRRLPSTVSPNEDDLVATAEGAMGVSLALASRHFSWRVERRLYSRLAERADWLMVDASGIRIPFEVRGTDEGDMRLAEKARQARESPYGHHGRAGACVVRFSDPRAILWRTEDDAR